MKIIIFKARDGRWSYCPDHVRHDIAFCLNGEFDHIDEAVVACNQDPSNVGFETEIENEN